MASIGGGGGGSSVVHHPRESPSQYPLGRYLVSMLLFIHVDGGFFTKYPIQKVVLTNPGTY